MSFGFKKHGKKGNSRSPQERQRLDRRNRMWCLDYFKLEALGLNPSAAAKAIAALWQQQTGEAFTWAAVKSAVTATKQQYTKERSVTFTAASDAWTMEEKRALLRAYGSVNLPRQICKAYGI